MNKHTQKSLMAHGLLRPSNCTPMPFPPDITMAEIPLQITSHLKLETLKSTENKLGIEGTLYP